ncbi:MAG: peptidylprolyl isomerase [Pseudomonadota bacterium]
MTPTNIAAFGLVLLLTGAPAESRDALCASEGGNQPHLQIETSQGNVTIRLFPEAAPGAVASLVAMLEPTADAAKGEASAADTITFDYTRPHMEVRTTAYAAGDPTAPIEIDAEALGLHEQRIETVGEAMNVVQDELLPAFRRARRSDALSPQLISWVGAWYENYEADFLVGASRKQINEALGHAYETGLESRPVVEGSVALKPASKTATSTRLSIALKDMPRRTGTWMVIGEVTQGLDLVDRISVAPLHRPRHVRTRTHEPLHPVSVTSLRMECG